MASVPASLLVLDPDPHSASALQALGRSLGLRVETVAQLGGLVVLALAGWSYESVVFDSRFAAADADAARIVVTTRGLVKPGGRAIYLADPHDAARTKAAAVAGFHVLAKPADPGRIETLLTAAMPASVPVGNAEGAGAHGRLGAVPHA